MKYLVKVPICAVTVLVMLSSMAFGSIGGTIAASPTQLPKGAFVNGSGEFGDQYFLQNITILDFSSMEGAITPGDGDYILINFPTEIEVADPDEDGSYDDGVWLSGTYGGAGGGTIVVGTVTASSIQIDITTAGSFGATTPAADALSIIFPVTTDETPADLTPTYTIRYWDADAGPAAFLATDDLLTVSLEDTLTLDVFAADYIGNDDNGTTRGYAYPTDVLGTPADIVPAGLPALVTDYSAGANDIVDQGGAAPFDGWGGMFGADGVKGGGDDLIDNDAAVANEMTYYIWASQTSGLERVNSGNGHRVIDINDGNPVDVANEAGTIAGQLDGRLLDEGYWWFYLTCNASADWILASSDTVEIRHQPTFTYLDPGAIYTNDVAQGGGVDYDGDRNWENFDGQTDDVAAMTVESGGTLGPDNVIGSAGSTDSVNIFYSFDDEDDSATVQIFLSTSAALVAADINISGTAPNEVVDSLSSATVSSMEITTTPLPEHTSTPYFTYDILPASGIPEPANVYYIYLVANDGKNQNLLKCQRSSAATDIALTVAHYPYLTLEDYYGEDIDVNRGSERYVVVSWAGTAQGIDGAKDGDQSASSPATISVYAVEDADAVDTWALAGGSTNPAAVDPTILPAAATARPTAVELIGNVSDITSNDADDNRIMWDLWTTGLADGTYHIYAIITHGSDDLIVDLNTTEVIDGTGVQRDIVIASTNYFLPNNPVGDDLVELNTDDLYNFTWTAFNVQTAQTEQVHIFMLPKDTDIDAILLANAPNTQDYAGLIANAALFDGGYWLTDDDGDPAAGLAPVTASLGSFTLDVSDMTADMAGAAKTPATDADALSVFYNYDVYYIYKSDAAFSDEPYIKAPGLLHFANDVTVGTNDNFKLTPSKAHLAMGDTVTITVQYVDAGPNAEWLMYYLNVPKTYFRVLDQDAATAGIQPFSDLTGFTGTNMKNELDSSDTHYYLDRVEYAAGGQDVPGPAFASVASFQLVVDVAATEPALVDNIITFNTTQPRMTSYQKTGSSVQVGFTVSDAPANLQLAGRGSITGLVEMEMRAAAGEQVTIKITPTGSLVPISDADFYSASGDLSGDASDGIQLALGTGGSYTLTQVPGGTYEVYIEKAGWLTRVVKSVEVSPLTTASADFLAFEQLYTGDAGGFDHDGDGGALTFSQPDNQIDATDLAVHIAAFEAVQGVDDEYNAYADFDNDGVNSLAEFAITAKNDGIQIDLLHDGTALLPIGRGEGPTFKAIPFEGDNSQAIAWMSVKEHAGQQTFTIHADKLSSVRAYKVALSYDPEQWEVTSWDDGLAEHHETHRFEKARGHEVKYVSSVRGWDALKASSVELMSLSMKALSADAMAPVLESVSLVEGNMASAEAIISGTGNAVPDEFTLSQNYPNPFNPTTTITFSLPEAGNVKLAVYNMLGQEVRTLMAGSMEPGTFKAVWNSLDNSGRKASTGLYFYRLTVNNKVVGTRKLMLLK